MNDRAKGALRRLNVLQGEAEQTPVPTRKYFHIGKPTVMEDTGEVVPLLSWVDDNLSRYVLADAPSSSWGRVEALVLTLPNVTVRQGDGVFVVSGPGDDSVEPHPEGKGRMHFVHLGRSAPLFGTARRLYLYRLEGVQMKNL